MLRLGKVLQADCPETPVTFQCPGEGKYFNGQGGVGECLTNHGHEDVQGVPQGGLQVDYFAVYPRRLLHMNRSLQEFKRMLCIVLFMYCTLLGVCRLSGTSRVATVDSHCLWWC